MKSCLLTHESEEFREMARLEGDGSNFRFLAMVSFVVEAMPRQEGGHEQLSYKQARKQAAEAVVLQMQISWRRRRR